MSLRYATTTFFIKFTTPSPSSLSSFTNPPPPLPITHLSLYPAAPLLCTLYKTPQIRRNRSVCAFFSATPPPSLKKRCVDGVERGGQLSGKGSCLGLVFCSLRAFISYFMAFGLRMSCGWGPARKRCDEKLDDATI